MRTASFGLAALYAALLCGSILLLGAVVYWTVQGSLERQMRARIDAEIDLLQQELASEGTEELVREVNERTTYFPGFSYLITDANGRRLTGNLSTMPSGFGWSDAEQEPIAGNVEKHFLVKTVALGQGIRLAVGDDLEPYDDIQEALLEALGAVLVVLVLLILSGGLILSRTFLSRVDAIRETAESIIEGKLNSRVPLLGTDDHFDRLSGTLNRMLDRIGSLVESLAHVSAEIAHALRTPLGRLQQKLEVARDNARLGAQDATSIDSAIAETETIIDTFSALLRIAQIEAADRYRAFRDVNMSALFGTVAEAFSVVAEEEGKQLKATIEPGLECWGDVDLLGEMLANLLDNAIRHTPPGTWIELTLEERDSRLTAKIADSGPGIPARDRKNVFRRFYRLERSSKTPGNGLGLALVAAVAELHEIELSLGDNNPGLIVSLAFQPRQRRTNETAQSTGAEQLVAALAGNR